MPRALVPELRNLVCRLLLEKKKRSLAASVVIGLQGIGSVGGIRSSESEIIESGTGRRGVSDRRVNLRTDKSVRVIDVSRTRRNDCRRRSGRLRGECR